VSNLYDCYCQVHLHSQNDIPEVSDLGFAVEPGKYALVVVERSVVSKLNGCREYYVLLNAVMF